MRFKAVPLHISPARSIIVKQDNYTGLMLFMKKNTIGRARLSGPVSQQERIDV